jgi:hypothetical protein
MEDITEQLALRDRYLKKVNGAKTPEQRMAEAWVFLKFVDATMRSNPAGYAKFVRRNYKKRATTWSPDDAR